MSPVMPFCAGEVHHRERTDTQRPTAPGTPLENDAEHHVRGFSSRNHVELRAATKERADIGRVKGGADERRRISTRQGALQDRVDVLAKV